MRSSGFVRNLINLAEAAERLDTSTLSVRRMIRDGRLRPVYHIGRSKREEPWFQVEEVAALAQLRHRSMSLPELSAIAKTTAVKTIGLERQVAQLQQLLGLDAPTLPVTESAMLELYAEIELLLTTNYPDITTESVMYWARRFYAMGEEVFEALEMFTGDPEPWYKPIQLATRLFKLQPKTGDLELEAAYRHLQVARRFMRQAAYFYVRQKHGTRTAHRLFREVEGDLNQRVLAMVNMPRN